MIGSLFSGIGGLELGLEMCGLGPVLWQVEHDAFCRSILARHWPAAARTVSDVRDASAATLAPVDVLCGGFPCQPVSLAGKRGAQDDVRWLWPEIARVCGDLRPRYVFLENVPGLLTAGGGSAFGDVLGSLAALGYDATWDLFRASDVGAPHRRERWFLLAYRDGEGQPQPRGAESVERRRALDRGEGTVADAVRFAQLGRESQRVPGSAISTVAPARGEGLVNATGITEREQTTPPHALADRGQARPFPGRVGECVGVGLADADRARLEEQRGLDGDDGAQRSPAVRGDGRDDAGTAESRVGGDAHGLPSGVDGPWPAGRGAEQHAWEPPRTARGVPMRSARLKALGNAVVPAQAALAWRTLRARALEDV